MKILTPLALVLAVLLPGARADAALQVVTTVEGLAALAREVAAAGRPGP